MGLVDGKGWLFVCSPVVIRDVRERWRACVRGCYPRRFIISSVLLPLTPEALVWLIPLVPSRRQVEYYRGGREDATQRLRGALVCWVIVVVLLRLGT
mmetsp:Transcript_7981/g.16037  ORF Transcript_7981/g.16037 Transcript_7981/m.16037 type:complete len:97 (-) Transcript_7981:210-500(-)